MKHIVWAAALGMLVAGQVWAAEAPAVPAAAPAAAAPVMAAPAETAPAAGAWEVAEAAIATGVENRQPVGAAEKFSASAGKLFCWSKISGGAAGGEIVHEWRKGEEVVAEVKLNIGGSPWRVYSSKVITPEMTGKWSVAIKQGDQVLKTLEFEVE
jgi:hypothetical protein